MTSGIDEEQSAVDTRVLDVAIALRREFLAKICAVLVLRCISSASPRINKTITLMYLTIGSQLRKDDENRPK